MRKINYNMRHKFEKVRVFHPRAWENIGWQLGRMGIPWCRACNQFGKMVGGRS